MSLHKTNRRARVSTVDRWQKQFDTVLIASSMRSAPRKKSRIKRLTIICKLLIGMVCQNKAYKEKAGWKVKKLTQKKLHMHFTIRRDKKRHRNDSNINIRQGVLNA